MQNLFRLAEKQPNRPETPGTVPEKLGQQITGNHSPFCVTLWPVLFPILLL